MIIWTWRLFGLYAGICDDTGHLNPGARATAFPCAEQAALAGLQVDSSPKAIERAAALDLYGGPTEKPHWRGARAAT